MRPRVLYVFFVLLGAVGAWAAEAPVAVSPGDTTNLVQIGDSCPTFSWSWVPDAPSYELVVYRLGEGSEEEQPVLRQSFTGSVSSWTPALDRCLERGGRYAWSVRAEGGERTSDWSAPALFQVASPSSVADLEAAVEVLRSQLAAREADASGAARYVSGEAPSAVAPLTDSREREEASATALTTASGITIDGDYKFSNNRFYSLNIAGSAFGYRDNNDTWIAQDDCGHISVAVATPLVFLNEPVHLPEGATVTAFICYIQDNSPDDLHISASLRGLGKTTVGSGSFEMADITLDLENVQQTDMLAPFDLNINSAVIDNFNNRYWIRVNWNPDSTDPNMVFCGCEVRYKVDRAL